MLGMSITIKIIIRNSESFKLGVGK